MTLPPPRAALGCAGSVRGTGNASGMVADVYLSGEIMKSVAPRAMSVLLAIAAGGLLLVASTGSWAQQKQKYFFKDPGGLTKYTQQHVLDVGDVPGHQIRVATLQAKYANEAPQYDGVKVVESTAWLTSDYIDGNGHFSQYSVLQMANGDRIFTRTEGLSQTSVGADGGKKTTYSTVVTLSGGTGKFATIRGTIRVSGNTDFKTGTSGNVSEGEYWLEK
jgi:hypothetical protein